MSCKKSSSPNDKPMKAVEPLERKKKAFDDKECANCGAQGSCLSKCSRCKLTFYCCQACQLQHWSAVGGHKSFCVSADKRSPDPMVPIVPNQSEIKCAICQENISALDETVLPCSHVFHSKCVINLRESGGIQKKACPVCRSPIKEEGSAKEIFECAEVYYKNVRRAVDRSEC
jgi:hypothetical protein